MTHKNPNYMKEYRKNNKEKIKELCKEYREKNSEKIKKCKSKHYRKNKKEILKQHKGYYIKNKEKYIKQVRDYSNLHTDKIRKYMKEYRVENKDKRIKYEKHNKNKILINAKKYYNKNKEKISLKKKKTYKIWRKKYWKLNKDKIIQLRKKRRNNDLNYKILENLRTRVWYVLKGNSKSKKTKELIGCPIEELKYHLEKQFTFGMNWKNYGYGWHLDHIVPCCKFDLSKEEEQEKCFHYTNLQPLWATENLKKGDKIIIE